MVSQLAKQKTVPRDIVEDALRNYKPNGLTNLTSSELYRSAVDYVSLDKHGTLNQVYFFFTKNDRSVIVPIAGEPQLAIAFDLERYGFSDDEHIKISPRRIDLPLYPDAKRKYEKLLFSKSMRSNFLFEDVGFIVNDLMEYNFERLRALRIEHQEALGIKKKERERDMEEFDERVEHAKKVYKPSGKEVVRGVCKDAGDRIRELLLSLRMEELYGYTYARSDSSETLHDTTLVFNKRRGRWVVINSKSPVKPWNLVPKEALPEFGRPFTSFS